MKINENYKNLNESYLFSTISSKVMEFLANNPDRELIRLGIGDVTRPLTKSTVEALASASCAMGTQEDFHGYGPEQGYSFLREKIKEYYLKNGANLRIDEIFVSDGAKSDLGNILDIFSTDNLVLIPNPVYPVYVDTNIMAGRRIMFLDANQQNNFLPLPDENLKADIVYLCSPNNPTGAAYSRDDLEKWVNWAIKNEAVILFDAAYECFISDKNLPKSIFEIEGAKKCAIEFCSLSKMAGFTGTRLGYTVVPTALSFDNMSLNKMWLRRQTTKFNGVPYIIQKGAEAVFTPQGQREILENINYYKINAKVIADTMADNNIWHTGGIHSPYIWFKCPNGMQSWEFFDYMLNSIAVVGTPGIGFGSNGEGFFRLTAFGTYEKTVEAMKRFNGMLRNM